MIKTRNIIILIEITVLAFLLVVLMGLFSQFIPSEELSSFAASEEGQQSPGAFGAVVLMQFLTALGLSLIVLRSRWPFLKLSLGVFVVYFLTSTGLNQLESLVYLESQMDRGMLYGITLMGFFTALAFSPLLVVALWPWRNKSRQAEVSGSLFGEGRSWVGKLIGAGAIYLTFYYLFGYYVAWQSPVLRDYYGGEDPGSFFAQMSGIIRGTPWMVPFQFLRGILWAAMALLTVRMMGGKWWEAGIALSFVFGAPAFGLLMPNPIMPEAIRMVHFVETLPYQILFAWVSAYIFAVKAGPSLDGEQVMAH